MLLNQVAKICARQKQSYLKAFVPICVTKYGLLDPDGGSQCRVRYRSVF